MSAYLYYNTEFVADLRAKDPDLKQGDLFKMAGAKWATMTDTEKAKYNKLSQQDKLRYQAQLDEREKKGYFMLENGTKSTDPANAKLFKVKKSVGDEEEEEEKGMQPKRPQSSYMYFQIQYIKQLRQKDATLQQAEYMKLAGNKWAELSEKDKEKYD